MLTGDDFVKITDFGTAQIMQYGAAQQTSATGTPAYMSPEQIKGKAVDGRTDIFSLGVMLYEMTTGQKPFRGQDVATILYQILNEEPLPPHQESQYSGRRGQHDHESVQQEPLSEIRELPRIDG
jgi:serine/threonine protein kinase